MTEREALKLALEALEFIPESGSMLGAKAEEKRLQAITAIKEALAQPEQEPVAWMYQCNADSSGPCFMEHKTNWAESGSGLWTETPLYTPQPKSEWVGLTDWEINSVANNNNPLDGIRTFARAIEAKLKEKNT